MPSVPVFTFDGKQKETVDLPDTIFGSKVNTDIIHQAVVMYRAAQRQGNAKTKGRAEVSGGGKKPFRQKGTGRARAGSTRSPLWMGGGVIFGPVLRDYSYSIPKKIRVAALRESLNAKFQDQDLTCIQDLSINSSKTKDFAKALSGLNLKGKILALWDGKDANVIRISRNIPYFNLKRYQDVNAYDVMCSKKILITKTALQDLLKRIK